MTNTTNSDSGLNLDHLEALAHAADQGEGQHIYTNPRDSNGWQANEAWHRAASPAAVLELIALARRAAPVSAPTHCDPAEGFCAKCREQERAYKQAQAAAAGDELRPEEVEALLTEWFGLEDCKGLFNPGRMAAFANAARKVAHQPAQEQASTASQVDPSMALPSRGPE